VTRFALLVCLGLSYAPPASAGWPESPTCRAVRAGAFSPFLTAFLTPYCAFQVREVNSGLQRPTVRL
jgi:hypothetical protein